MCGFENTKFLQTGDRLACCIFHIYLFNKDKQVGFKIYLIWAFRQIIHPLVCRSSYLSVWPNIRSLQY